ncbi:hypothetical protein [Pseudoblastomonas halimionae]|uniref:Uncharacterized protein n=1 Tax=Alteriqipengyuania halimionae TaxID=1926630 RepID=A0A6I4U083_9SPHN|nr:hypothetical protein [Alteriqipengyuania halimionae]MXP09390.1 hypothetical protein [Alteriqipengyuania halimionae]
MTKLALFAAPALAIALSACATVPTSPVVDSDRDILSRDALVPFNQPVWVSNALIATPTGLIEDSRCPENARCIHAGRAVVETRLDGIGWRQTVELELGKPYTVRGETVMLATVQPENQADRQTPMADYRFAYE